MDKSKVKSYAAYLRRVFGFDYIKSIRAAANAIMLTKALKNEFFIHLTFKKLNGEIRKIWATTAQVLIPKLKRPKNKGYYYTELQVRFFDIQLAEWRSCRIENVIAIV